MRLIDANALIYYDARDMVPTGGYITTEDIDDAPTIDLDAITAEHERIGYDKGFRDGQAANEPERGKWSKHIGKVVSDDGLWGETLYDCSNCGHTVHVATKFCSKCGARMEE